MSRRHRSLMLTFLTLLAAVASTKPLHAQPLGEADQTAPGDGMIQYYLKHEALKLFDGFQEDAASLEAWQANRQRYLDEYYYMLGLSPVPEKTPLQATITGTLQGDGYVVDMLHYQSRPGLYVTGNLYRPAGVEPDQKLPAIFYVCGHSGRGRNGNKVAYQSHGIWFARHGYICLVVDSLQLGEIGATHHGTYNLQRWWWHSRGYTPAGVEAWNGVRGIDYLLGRPDVDPDRIAVTGISGGGAATFWVTVADDRVSVAVPISGMADLPSYIPNRVINGHCDCMFMYNTFQWPWARIAAMVAPRPMLFVNSDQDRIFPMDANDRISNRMERLYSLYGAGDQFDAVVSIGGHAYRRDIRQAAYRFINTHLLGDPAVVDDSEQDVVSEGGNPGPYAIEPERLRVFPTDDDLPSDQLNTTIDERFVPLAQVAVPAPEQFTDWKQSLTDELRRVSFGTLPDTIRAANSLEQEDTIQRLQAEMRIEFYLRYEIPELPPGTKSVLLVVVDQHEAGEHPEWVARVRGEDQAVVYCETRGIGATRWTLKNPPNYVERAHALLGRTVDTGRVWDIAAAAAYLADKRTVKGRLPVHVAGQGSAGLLAAYAALWTDQIASVTLVSPATTHLDSAAPQFLNVLRVCDVPESLGLLAPRPLRIVAADKTSFAKTQQIYAAAQASDQIELE